MSKERKISDDELVEITGGTDGPIGDLEPGLGTGRDSGAGSAGIPGRTPGGGTDPEAGGGTGDGSQELF